MEHLTPLLERRALARRALQRLADSAPTEAGDPGAVVDLASGAPADDAYVAALLDALGLLGALDLGQDMQAVRVGSAQAGYLLRVLAALLDAGAPLIADWSHEGAAREATQSPATGIDLLAALERRRLELSPGAAALREIVAAIGLIARRAAGGGREFLLAWDAPASAWQFVGGRYERRDGSPRATLLRELSEELGCEPLAEGRDVLLQPIGAPFAEQRLSPTYGLLTRTTFHVYAVRFVGGAPPQGADVRWIAEPELLAGATSDGQPVASAPLVRLRARPDLDLDAFLTE
ncbi:MAG: NUDIX domain-containing protein [Kouleothrix sp.]|nr:NUDIX domain-containing protein [Kouleothrix sp.]